MKRTVHLFFHFKKFKSLFLDINLELPQIPVGKLGICMVDYLEIYWIGIDNFIICLHHRFIICWICILFKNDDINITNKDFSYLTHF